MKKLTLILLSLVLCVSLFACGDVSDTSSSSSTASDRNEHSDTVTNSNSDLSFGSESVDDFSKPMDQILPEKILYYSGRTYSGAHNLVDLPRAGAVERYSGNHTNALEYYINNNQLSGDTYFLVGIIVKDIIRGEVLSTDKINAKLEETGFIIEHGHPFAAGEYRGYTYQDIDAAGAPILMEKYSAVFPNADLSVYEFQTLCTIPLFDAVGYLDSETYEKLKNNDELLFEFTWLTTSENNEQWLDMDVVTLKEDYPDLFD